jgi:hypothetical protein
VQEGMPGAGEVVPAQLVAHHEQHVPHAGHAAPVPLTVARSA